MSYVLSRASAVLRFRGYRRGRTRLLFWSSLYFLGLAVNNVLLLIDFVVLGGNQLWNRARGATLRAGVGAEMTGATMLQSLWGALAMACAVAGLLFLRLWRLSRERSTRTAAAVGSGRWVSLYRMIDQYGQVIDSPPAEGSGGRPPVRHPCPQSQPVPDRGEQ